MISIIPKITKEQFRQDCIHGGCLWYTRKYAKPTDKIGWFYASYNCENRDSYNKKTPFELTHQDEIFPHHYFIIHPNHTYEDANGLFQSKSDLFRAWVRTCDVPWHLNQPQIYDVNNQVAIAFNLDDIAIRKYHDALQNTINFKTIFKDYKSPVIYQVIRSDNNDETDYQSFMAWQEDGIIPDNIMTQRFNELYTK